MQITRHNEPNQTNGEPPVVGHQLPDFTVIQADGTTLIAQDLRGAYTLISVVPNIDTRVCSISTKRFNESVDRFHHINFLTVSTNTVADQAHWCAAENVHRMQLVSDQEHHFGGAMGLYIASDGTDARSVWIIDPQGKVAYRELITEQTHEPDYDSALAYLEAHQELN
ncbi:thiol peroxidase [Lacticaseibacillus thailandensis]|uniref:Thiol peroxidase n=1 Tax=Lacticaseibacillus thailandensis DSM 22698 = JCM 13996 TaxID=1423810 RepID=A0A0R2CEF0_9LACO|nr:peroxiredoxin [Lacticaseibacillus thailandensis]KRM86747.1 thiol peroxidase [Lacticaseibacillus thailandensis DSM 22698 = JCM 13996]